MDNFSPLTKSNLHDDRILSNEGTELSVISKGGLRLGGLIKHSRPRVPLVTIITATFNDCEHLARTIDSIRGLTYKNVEWIIVDGASSDRTVEVIKQSEDIVDYWVSEPDNGIYDAWNKGLSLANGDWIAFLGAGDTYQANALDIYVQGISGAPSELEFVSSRMLLVNENGLHLRIWGAPFNWKKFKKYMGIAHVGALHHRRLFEKNGTFSTSYSSSSDYEFFMRYGSKLSTLYLDAITANQLIGGISNSTKSLYETYLIQRQYGENIISARFRYLFVQIKRCLRPFIRGY